MAVRPSADEGTKGTAKFCKPYAPPPCRCGNMVCIYSSLQVVLDAEMSNPHPQPRSSFKIVSTSSLLESGECILLLKWISAAEGAPCPNVLFRCVERSTKACFAHPFVLGLEQIVTFLVDRINCLCHANSIASSVIRVRLNLKHGVKRAESNDKCKPITYIPVTEMLVFQALVV